MKRIVIIGGMAAGCRAAARLGRLSSEFQVTVVEKGPVVSFSSCGLPLYAAGEIDSIDDLMMTSYGRIRDPEYFSQVKGVEILLRTEAEEIDPEKKEIRCRKLETEEILVLPYDSLIVTTGARAIKPDFYVEQSPFISPFHTPADAQRFRKTAQSGKIGKAVIIGGGFVGCELLESLTSLWGIETVLIEKENTLLSGCLEPELSSFLESSLKKNEKIQLKLSTAVEGLDVDDLGKPVIILKNGQRIGADYVFYCLGVKPETKLAIQTGIKTGPNNGIIVDDQMRTNIPNIWAAGDCVEVRNLVSDKTECFSLGSLSNRMGRTVAEVIAGKRASFDGATGTISLKLFKSIVCTTGLTEVKARKLGLDAGIVIGCWPDRPDYYPESKNLFGKLVYEKQSMRLLGLQLIGEGEVTRYIDLFTELLSQRKSVEALVNVEHAYTPAHSSPVSPLNFLGYMALNQEFDGIKNESPLNIASFKGKIIDVREEPEIQNEPFYENPVCIPISELSSMVNEFNTDQPIMFVCEKGPRSYEAARLFQRKGFKKVSYLGGGILLYSKVRQLSGSMEVHYE